MNPSENDYAYHGGNGAIKTLKLGFPGGPTLQCKEHGFNPWSWKDSTSPSNRKETTAWEGSLHTTMKSSPCSSQLEKTHAAIKTQHSQEIK